MQVVIINYSFQGEVFSIGETPSLQTSKELSRVLRGKVFLKWTGTNLSSEIMVMWTSTNQQDMYYIMIITTVLLTCIFTCQAAMLIFPVIEDWSVHKGFVEKLFFVIFAHEHVLHFFSCQWCKVNLKLTWN